MVATMNAAGLKITGPIEDYATPVRAAPPIRCAARCAASCGGKGQHTETAARTIAPLLAAAGRYSRSNGLNGAAIAEASRRRRAWCWRWSISPRTTRAGTIHYGGRGSVYVGEPDGQISPRVND